MADVKQIEDKTTTEPEDELAGSEAPLLEHLIELRKRLINIAIAIVVLMVVCFLFAGQIFDLLLNPYRSIYTDPGQMELIYTAPQEFFFTQLNLAFFGAIFLGFPYLATQIYLFVAPGLYKHERKALVPYLVATPIFFLLGAAMVYFAVLPMAMHFFAGMQTSEIKLLAKVSEYLSLAMTLILAFGICFQLPVVLTLLAQIDLIGSKTLKHGRRYAIVGILVAAALITPPDPISQIGLAMPMYALYELSILSVRMVERRRAKAAAAEASAES
ncbi:twin-arginine translocase subunit TatC [Devosia sp. PTR5]|uniref:Sec-independent protein translocase protein TatC n=1 Tax=Devosia oryzisoli TaxID=2774138 RepID=A0A927FRF8_9HYPH|nr:twin-arginine translocase subunit TatC [Devosia oryzisoli]MBD8064870.1 twin-arginine translocase subunit TatC [Devosia oryzisoli]